MNKKILLTFLIIGLVIISGCKTNEICCEDEVEIVPSAVSLDAHYETIEISKNNAYKQGCEDACYMYFSIIEHDFKPECKSNFFTITNEVLEKCRENCYNQAIFET